MEHHTPSSTASKPSKAIIRKIILLFGLLITVIIGNAAYSILQEIKHTSEIFHHDMEDQLTITSSMLQGELDKLKIISGGVREQGQRFSEFLDYDKLDAITSMLKTIGHLHGIDMVFFSTSTATC